MDVSWLAVAVVAVGLWVAYRAGRARGLLMGASIAARLLLECGASPDAVQAACRRLERKP